MGHTTYYILQALQQLMNQLNKQPKLEWVARNQNTDTLIDTTTLPIGTQ